MKEKVRFDNAEVAPEASIRVLRPDIDTKLRWGSHTAQVKAQAATQARVIKCLAGSTWGATFERCRIVYGAVVRPMLTFVAPIWHTPTGQPRVVLGRSRQYRMTAYGQCSEHVKRRRSRSWRRKHLFLLSSITRRRLRGKTGRARPTRLILSLRKENRP
jgi:hypothetical protein